MINPIIHNSKLKIEKIQSVELLDDKLKNLINSNDSQDQHYVIKFMMQDFLNKMYSTIDECPYSVNDKQEW